MTALEMLTGLKKSSIAHQPTETILINNLKAALHSTTNNTVKLLAKRKIDNNQKKGSEWNNLAIDVVDTVDTSTQWNNLENNGTSFLFNNETNEIIEKNLAATISSIRNNVTRTISTTLSPLLTPNHATGTHYLNIPKTTPSITYPSYKIEIRSYENCSALFANYTQPQPGAFCNWAWDRFLCWPPTPAGVLARMHCPSGWHGIDTRKFANRKCELNGQWGSRPNDTYNPNGWTDYQPCYKPEVNELMQQVPNLDLFLEIARRTRTLEIVGLILSLVALIISLIIFCNFRSLRNNRTKIHKNLFIAMVLQVIIRLTLYLDQAFHRGKQETATNTSITGIENTPYLCEASYVLLEYARTAMFMWMFIEGWYLHNMVTVTVFQGRFPHTIFTLVGWGMPVLMTTVWAICTAIYHDSAHDCWWNYNLTPYYWILEGPRLIVILLNLTFLINIIRVLVVKLRQSQASDIEQTRKAVRAAIVLLPLLGITNVLQLVPDLHTPWKFALWSYVTHFLTSFQGFFIALIYCFLNGEVRAVLLKSLAVYMSVRGHPEWVPKRASMYSAAYNTAPDTEAQANHLDNKRNDSPPTNKPRPGDGRKASTTTVMHHGNNVNPKTHLTSRLSVGNVHRYRQGSVQSNNNTSSIASNTQQQQQQHHGRHSWMFMLCFRGHKVLRVPSAPSETPESVVFELSEQ
uniref:G-protein coupled receptors family 2 profile 2 domain-containing protein n=1 Tax=Glossina brevipalpis TaxID=37001 RepID=A0A1A9W8S2_9MUSC